MRKQTEDSQPKSDQIVQPIIEGQGSGDRGIECRKVSYSTFSTFEIKRVVSRYYDLGDPHECVLFARGVNDVYSILAPSGRFALRVTRSGWQSSEAIEGELEALAHIGARGALASMPIRRADGDWITEVEAPEGLRRAVLFEWAHGRPLAHANPIQARLYGEHLAQLHTATDDLRSLASRPRIDATYLLHIPLSVIKPHLSQLSVDAARLESLGKRLEERLGRAERVLCDRGFCHGDIHAGNVRINENSAVSFDFDACGSGWRIYDLASFRWDARKCGMEEAAWEPFIEGYLKLRPSAADSLEYMGLFTILRHLWLTGQWIVFSQVIGQSLLPDDFFETLVTQCENIEVAPASVRQTFFHTWPSQLAPA